MTNYLITRISIFCYLVFPISCNLSLEILKFDLQMCAYCYHYIQNIWVLIFIYEKSENGFINEYISQINTQKKTILLKASKDEDGEEGNER